MQKTGKNRKETAECRIHTIYSCHYTATDGRRTVGNLSGICIAQKEYQGLPFKVVGIASGREEALVLVEIMVNDCIDERGTVDLKAYLDF